MAKITNAINVPVSSSTEFLTLGNGNTFLGINTLDCKGSAAFGTVAGTAAPANSLVMAPFFGGGTSTQFLAGSTAELVMPSTSTECDVLQFSYVGSSATNASNTIHLAARGTALAPTANQSGDTIGIWGARGYTGTGFSATSQASILMLANETWTTSANGTAIAFHITPNTTIVQEERVRILNTSASVSGVAASDLGAGFLIKEGSNARMGLAQLVSGNATIANTTITANTRIFLTNNDQDALSIISFMRVTGRTPGVSFSISSGITGDVSQVAWLLIEPA
ncbi:MAG TPA: hypothetical protein VGZ69_01965 [Candidatus Rhabdochlamydia sp.]|jgi:hypothetical protein|nr:hypothetical protein [Candidatus Rhabdochlamydia sp.]